MTSSGELIVLPVEITERFPVKTLVRKPRTPPRQIEHRRIYRISPEPLRAFTYGADGRGVADWPAGGRIDLYV